MDDDGGKSGDSESGSGHDENLDELATPFEVLPDHEGGRVANEADADAQHEAVTQVQLVKATREGAEEATESGDESAEDGRESRRLSLADADGQRRHEQRNAQRHRAQPCYIEIKRGLINMCIGQNRPTLYIRPTGNVGTFDAPITISHKKSLMIDEALFFVLLDPTL